MKRQVQIDREGGKRKYGMQQHVKTVRYTGVHYQSTTANCRYMYK